MMDRNRTGRIDRVVLYLPTEAVFLLENYAMEKGTCLSSLLNDIIEQWIGWEREERELHYVFKVTETDMQGVIGHRFFFVKKLDIMTEFEAIRDNVVQLLRVELDPKTGRFTKYFRLCDPDVEVLELCWVHDGTHKVVIHQPAKNKVEGEELKQIVGGK